MNKNEISLSLTNITADTTSSPSKKTLYSLPKDLFSCLICYETFGLDHRELVVLKCGHIFCGNCIQQWFSTNKVCPTCRKRCWLKDVLYIDLCNCIVTYGKKKIENLSVERDRLKDEIERLKESITMVEDDLRKTEYRLRDKQRFTRRLRVFSRRKYRGNFY